MERVVYDRMAELDSQHWWYRARREILSDLIAREARLPTNARILEIGCGTGHNIPMLFVTPLATFALNRRWVFG